MCGPGEYRPAPSAGITAPADLPQPEIVPYSRNDLRQPCPRCGHSAYRDKQAHRTLHAVGNLDLWCPRDLLVTYSQHYCTQCRKYFSADLSELKVFQSCGCATLSQRKRHPKRSEESDAYASAALSLLRQD
jgi:ribosomal protein L44E